jgi:hypothetical protein
MEFRVTPWIVGGVALLCAASLVAQEAAPAEHVQAMTDIRAAAQVLAAFGDSQDFEAAENAAISAATALEYVKEFWAGRDVDAGRLADTAWKAARDVRVAADLSSAEGVIYAASEMTATCMGCHTAHRDRLDDGSFVVK